MLSTTDSQCKNRLIAQHTDPIMRGQYVAAAVIYSHCLRLRESLYHVIEHLDEEALYCFEQTSATIKSSQAAKDQWCYLDELRKNNIARDDEDVTPPPVALAFHPEHTTIPVSIHKKHALPTSTRDIPVSVMLQTISSSHCVLK